VKQSGRVDSGFKALYTETKEVLRTSEADYQFGILGNG
jgi:hypothetical protein